MRPLPFRRVGPLPFPRDVDLSALLTWNLKPCKDFSKSLEGFRPNGPQLSPFTGSGGMIAGTEFVRELAHPTSNRQPPDASLSARFVREIRKAVLEAVARDGSVDRLFGSFAVRHGIESRRLARPCCSAPVHQVAVVAAVRVERQGVVSEEAPALGVGWHS